MLWSFVYAWIVVMKPCSMPNASSRTFAIGATQLVVHEALEMTLCAAGSYMSSFTPRTTVRSSPLAGALITTFSAPASMCLSASSRSVNSPVDSITMRAPSSFHGRFAGVALGDHPQLVAIDRDAVLADGDVGDERAQDRVVLEQVRQASRRR